MAPQATSSGAKRRRRRALMEESIFVMVSSNLPPDRNGARGGESIGAAAASKLPAGLYLVATPIGNLGDISRRALDILARVDRIAAEDTRVARRLLSALAIEAPRIERYDDHADAAMRERLLASIASGESVALISDAGMPVIADPGFKLVRAARAAGLRVTAAPGASAPLTALALSGLPSDRFFFAGFLPPRQAARRTALEEIARVPGTLILLEAPQRLAECLADLAAVLGGARPAVIARELTKMFEEVRSGTLAELAAAQADQPAPKGEIVLVVGAPPAEAEPVVGDAEIDARLSDALATMSLRDAVDAVAGALALNRRVVYARALALAGDRSR
jgi:16S rRNA (cytidine1402-2'-O)-methyltransferase